MLVELPVDLPAMLGDPRLAIARVIGTGVVAPVAPVARLARGPVEGGVGLALAKVARGPVDGCHGAESREE